MLLGGECSPRSSHICLSHTDSDTTASTLVSLFYELCHHPDEVEKLRAELAPVVNEHGRLGDFYDSDIGHLAHLNGAINEAMRLYPAVPSGVQRIMPPEGITVDGVSIPGNTTVINPVLAMGRCKSIPAGRAAKEPVN